MMRKTYAVWAILAATAMVFGGCETGAEDESAVADAASASASAGLQTPAIAAFDAAWNETASAALVRGQSLRIDYDPARLAACRAKKAGKATWNIWASYRFAPGGETGEIALYKGSSRSKIDKPLVQIPSHARTVEFWFRNADHTGCQAWDSNLGKNYLFAVQESDAAPAQYWIGNFNFVRIAGYNRWDEGDRDPAYYWTAMQGSRGNAWLEVEVWVPGITDKLAEPPVNMKLEALTNAFSRDPGTADDPAAYQGKELSFVKRAGNNFLYRFDFSYFAINTYFNPTAQDGLYSYRYRLSTDGGHAFAESTARKRFIVSTSFRCDLFPDHAPEQCPVHVDRTVGWAGNWGGRFDHGCTHVLGLPEPVRFEKSGLGHDCMSLDAEVYVAGLTDANVAAEEITAEVETDLGFTGGPLAELARYPLAYEGRVGNNYRFAWTLHENVGRADRGDYRFRFRFSADRGKTFYTLGLDDQGSFRTLHVRNDSHDVEPVQVCERIESWESAFQHTPSCLNYEMKNNVNVQTASYGGCAFYVNSFGRGSLSHNQSHASWIEAYINARGVEGEVLGAGIFAHYKDESGTEQHLFSMGTDIEDRYFKTGFTYNENQDYLYQLVDFAFFVDVRRMDGELERKWLSNYGSNYTLAQVFKVQGTTVNIGLGSIEYANETNPDIDLFDQKRLCQ